MKKLLFLILFLLLSCNRYYHTYTYKLTTIDRVNSHNSLDKYYLFVGSKGYDLFYMLSVDDGTGVRIMKLYESQFKSIKIHYIDKLYIPTIKFVKVSRKQEPAKELVIKKIINPNIEVELFIPKNTMKVER